MILKTIFQKKVTLFLFLLFAQWANAQEVVENSICSNKLFAEKKETASTTPNFLFLNVDYDKKNNLLTIHTREQLRNATITILTAKDQVIYQESAIKINNNYLLSIEQNSPKGIYYIYVEEENQGIWIERFIK